MEVNNEKDRLIIKLSVWEKIWGLHGDFTISRNNIVSISEEFPKSSWRDIKFPGTFFPGIIKAGTYLTPRGKEFWYWVNGREKIHNIELKNMGYKRLILSTSK